MTGVPVGTTVSLTVSAPGSVVLSSADCAGAGTRLICQIGNGAGTFPAVNSSGAPKTVTVRVGHAAGFDDPQQADNAATLTVS